MWPKITSSTSSTLIFDLLTDSLMTMAPSSWAGREASPPLKDPKIKHKY